MNKWILVQQTGILCTVMLSSSLGGGGLGAGSATSGSRPSRESVSSPLSAMHTRGDPRERILSAPSLTHKDTDSCRVHIQYMHHTVSSSSCHTRTSSHGNIYSSNTLYHLQMSHMCHMLDVKWHQNIVSTITMLWAVCHSPGGYHSSTGGVRAQVT